jgi:interferon gamma-inducible protein 30
VKTDLKNAWQAEGVADIMNLTIVPWGNAEIEKGNKFNCQHGPNECAGNRWEACAIAHAPVQQHIEFYFCFEAAGENQLKNVQKCATKAKMNYTELSVCYHGAEGTALQKKNAALTPKDHKYTPWVVVDGKSGADENFLRKVCAAYKSDGGTEPAGCKGALPSSRYVERDVNPHVL